MADHRDARARLGQLVAARRKQAGLSLARAAARAGIHRATWTGIEDGTRDTEDYIYPAIERVLGWAPGSIDAVLDGGTPTLSDVGDTAPPLPAPGEVDDLAEDIKLVLDAPGLSDGDKEQIIAFLRHEWDAEQQRLRARHHDRTLTTIEMWRRAKSG